MKKPTTPNNEEMRLNTLRSLNVLDTLPEERFDRLTRLAKRMFDVPMALVSLVDENRQWFKSSVGIDISEASRDISFCGHAILDDEIFIIPDTLKDERFSDNPFVLNSPYCRFYAGCPLRYVDGTMLGTLCIMDTKPRTFNADDLAALKDLAELAEHELMAVQLATQDELTKLSNRRGFIKLAQNSLDICIRHDIPSVLIYLDLNKFKAINDIFGHTEGDKALNAFSEILQKNVRQSNVVGRLGGDEFAIFLTDTSQETAEQTISSLRNSLQTHNQNSNSGYDISFSEGIVTIDYEKNLNLEQLLSQADSLMYDKKST
ncbi:diguanylate cyclase [Marinomonas ushuaiensis DSM 15871]|uniref:Diguanylate cyclase n=1 Tax=Marinomonas ushuaiensis DSM 15871 TaxID=1122207 RepID=X7E6G2_9GAMM|nr:sensor domain-containing diguanylate cyclase [Marinomonas ushuaiensis]ETX10753.1 diguanylate cyclase [Marinomonas ushuaiensis DSM 15871]